MDDMARYLLMICGNERRWEALTSAEKAALHEGHRRFRERAGTTLLEAGQLTSSTMATTLRPGQGKPIVTDGPFLDTKEVVGGFYVVEVEELDAALALAAALPELEMDHCAIQVQPLV
jgi:hypothetical protein